MSPATSRPFFDSTQPWRLCTRSLNSIAHAAVTPFAMVGPPCIEPANSMPSSCVELPASSLLKGNMKRCAVAILRATASCLVDNPAPQGLVARFTSTGKAWVLQGLLYGVGNNGQSTSYVLYEEP